MSTPLLLLHGFSSSPAAFDPLREHLPAGREVLAPWLPGHGEREPADSFDDAVDRFAAELEGPVELIGYSQGARLGLGLMIRHPEKIERALLVGGRPGLPQGSERWARVQWDQKWVTILREEGLEAFVDRWEQLPIFHGQSEAQRASQRALRLGHDPRRLARAMETLGVAAMPDLWEQLETIRVPVLLAAGSEDPKFCRIAEQMARRMPEARALVVEGCGHNPLLQAPARVAALLEETV